MFKLLVLCCAGERLRQTSAISDANGTNDETVSDELAEVAGRIVSTDVIQDNRETVYLPQIFLSTTVRVRVGYK